MKSYGWIISRLGLLALVWGSSFILMKRGLFDASGDPIFSGLQVGFLRITLAALTLLPFALKHRSVVKRSNAWPLFVAGFVGNGIPAICFAVAQTQINSALSGVLNSLTPFFTLILGALFFNVKGTVLKYLGVTVGLVGAAGLILSQSNFNFSFSDVGGYSLFVVAACLGYATSVNVIKTYLQELRPVQITAISFVMQLPLFLAGSLLLGVPQVIAHHPSGWSAFGFIAILGIVGTALAVILFNYVIRATSALTASSVTYLIPIVAVFWGVWDGEVFSWLDGLFALLIISGVYLVRTKKT